MANNNAIHTADQISAAIREVFLERGLDVEMTIPQEKHEAAGFFIKHHEINDEIMASVLQEALARLGGDYDFHHN
ncbi:MAG: hypothetical protein DWQ19_11960 [Crenarchaeota archaeon]|nr:MAG: hypothetical protein DWQ19_11960 [Thermoproteota archaeon]